MNIGIFDSGLGGLSIFREIVFLLPEYDYCYLGDNARVPYGNRSAELIFEFTKNAVDFLFRKNCSLVILACNTSSASALRKIQREFLPKNYPERKVLGVIRPVVETAFEMRYSKVGVVGTRATISSQSFLAEFKNLSTKIEVFQESCPLLVSIIEEGKLNWKGLDLILKEYLAPLKKKKIQALILGCTHYGLISESVQRAIGMKVKIISQGKATSLKLKDYLKRHPEVEKRLTKNGKRRYFITDLTKQYHSLVKLFLGKNFGKNNKLELVKI